MSGTVDALEWDLYVDISKGKLDLITRQDGKLYPGPPLPDNSHIRLVQLSRLAGTPGHSSIGLKYHATRLDSAPKFRALSYTWGSSSRPNDTNGLHVTDNLLSALTNLVEPEPQLWWIDAICINQSDVPEKNEQVRMMRRIYKKATDVYVWLGEPDLVTINLLRQIRHALDISMYNTPGMVFSNEELQRLGLPSFQDPSWGSLIPFLSRSYFNRLWVLQELVVAQGPITVACGHLRFHWDLIALPTQWLRENHLLPIVGGESGGLPTDGGMNLDLISLTLRLPEIRDTLTLEYLIGITRYFESTDPRDKIIALLGLVSPQDPSAAKINIDYRQPVAEFYREVTGTIITTQRSLKLLLLVTDKADNKIDGLPSWVPDYSSKLDRPNYRYKHFLARMDPVDVEWSPGSNALRVLGHVEDEVEWVASEMPSFGTDTAPIILKWYKEAAQFMSADPWTWALDLGDAERATNSNAEQFWRTMICDELEDHSPAPDEYRDHFARLLYEDYVSRNAEDTSWMITFACAALLALLPEMKNGVKFEFDEALTAMIEFLQAARRDKREIKDPPYIFPRRWIHLNEENKQSLGPQGDDTPFLVQANSKGIGRFFITKAGRMGKGPPHLQAGDHVTLVNGTEQVFLLRRDGKHFRLVGECYVHGLMHGQGRENVTPVWMTLV